MNTAPTWRPIDLGAVFKRIDRRFKWIGDHDVIFLVVFGLLFFAFSDVLMAGRLTPAGNSLSFIAAVLWSVLGLVFLVVYCLLLYSFVNQPEKRRLLRGVSCFFVLLLAVVSYYAGLFSLYGQSVNFVDRDVALTSAALTSSQCRAVNATLRPPGTTGCLVIATSSAFIIKPLPHSGSNPHCAELVPNLLTNQDCVVTATSAQPIGVLESIYLALGNISPSGPGIGPVSTQARVLVFGEMFTFVFVIFVFGSLYVASITRSDDNPESAGAD
jgi:hypothetical protein